MSEGVEEFVRRSTRSLKFDFELVSKALNVAIDEKEVVDGRNKRYTAQDCRTLFAKGYDVENVVPPSGGDEDTNNYTDDVAAILPPRPPLSVSEVLKTSEAPTNFTEALAFQKRIEEETARRSEVVFSRVLDSLGGAGDSALSSEAFTVSKEISDILEARKAQAALKAEQEREEQAHKEEQKFLRDQKERLRNRFAANSEDNEGINPLADGAMFRAQGIRDGDNDHDSFDSVANQFSFDDILSNPNFDRMLDDLEADLQASAADKSEEESPSELGEVLSFLSQTALTRQATTTSQKDSDRKIQLEPNITEVSSADILGSQSLKDNSQMVQAEKARIAYKAAAEEQVRRAAHARKVDEALTRAMGVYRPGKASKAPAQPPVNTDAAATTSDTTRHVHKAGDGGVQEEEEEEYNSEEDEDNWRRQRNTRKAESMSAPAATMYPKNAFGGSWGAYGASVADTAAGRMVKLQKQKTDPFFQDSKGLVHDEPAESESDDSEESDKEVEGVEQERIVVISDNEEEEEEDESVDESDKQLDTIPSVHYNEENMKEVDSTSMETPVVPGKDVEETHHVDNIISVEVKESVALLDQELEASSKSTLEASGSLGSLGTRQRGNRKKDRLKASVQAAKMKKCETETETEKSIPIDSEVDLSWVAGNVAKTVRSGELEAAKPEQIEGGTEGEVSLKNESQVVEDEPKSKFILESPLPDTYPSPIQGETPIMVTIPMSSFREHSSAGLSCIFDVLGHLEGTISIMGLQMKRSDSSMSDILELMITGAMQFYELKVEEAFDTITVEQACEGKCSTECFTHHPGTNFGEFCSISSFDAVATKNSPHFGVADASSMDSVMQHTEQVVSCSLKPYMLEYPSQIAVLLRMCERNGLRLCNLRTVQLHHDVKYGTHLHQEIKAHLSTVNKPTCSLTLGFYHPDGDAAEKLREALGPDDPLLARRTDPKSIRAIMGIDRLQNVAFPVSHSAARVLGDWLFMFGPRTQLPLITTGSFLIPKNRSMLFGVSFTLINPCGPDMMSASLSSTQMRCLKWMSSLPIKETQIITWGEFKGIFSDAAVTKGKGTTASELYMVFHCNSTGGDLWVEETKAKMAALSTDRKSAWELKTFMKCTDRVANAIVDKPGKNVLKSSKGSDQRRFQTHEDIGLQDTVLVRGFIAQVFDTIASIPSTCNTHIVALKGRLGKCTAVLRGTNIYSSVDSTIALIRSRKEEQEDLCNESLPTVLKGEKCLNTIIQEFSSDRIFLDIALIEKRTYVPDYVSSASEATVTDVPDTLFLPGVFDALAVILVPWKIVTGKGGHLARIIKRLEREGIRLVRTGCVTSRDDLIKKLEHDYKCEYGESTVSLNAGLEYLSLLVRGNSCIRRLRDIVGPIDADVDENPRMLNACLKANILATLSTFSSESIIRECFKYQASLWTQSPDHSQDLSSEDIGVFLEHMCDLDSKATIAFTNANSCFTVSSVEDALGVPSIDLTCIALTAALQADVQLSTILEQLAREGLSIVNMRSLQLTKKSADELLHLAGQSSLALKCNSTLLSPSPVLLLAIEGPPHAVMRVKQFDTPKSSNFPNASNLQYHAPSSRSLLWKMNDGEIGVVAPSSAKLAKEMILHYFGQLFGKVEFVPSK